MDDLLCHEKETCLEVEERDEEWSMNQSHQEQEYNNRKICYTISYKMKHTIWCKGL
jgi:hypothetical protein